MNLPSPISTLVISKYITKHKSLTNISNKSNKTTFIL